MVFAVGVDLFHVAVPAVTSSAVVERLVYWTEAASELAGMALLLACAVHVARRERADRRRALLASVDPWPEPRAASAKTRAARPRAAR